MKKLTHIQQMRLQQIKRIANELQSRGVTHFTTYTLAKWMHVSPSTYLNKLMLTLVEHGEFNYIEVLHRPNRTKRLWCLPENHVVQLSLFEIDNP